MIGAQLANHGIDLDLDLAEDLPMVWGHPHPMEQVFLNLLTNARDALNDKGEPSKARDDKQIRVRTRYKNQSVVAEVTDNGIGMDEAERERVFEPFFTTKEADQGTGLGLSISYAIVKNHSGEITCQSRKGEGTVFQMRLPIADEEPL